MVYDIIFGPKIALNLEFSDFLFISNFSSSCFFFLWRKSAKGPSHRQGHRGLALLGLPGSRRVRDHYSGTILLTDLLNKNWKKHTYYVLALSFSLFLSLPLYGLLQRNLQPNAFYLLEIRQDHGPDKRTNVLLECLSTARWCNKSTVVCANPSPSLSPLSCLSALSLVSLSFSLRPFPCSFAPPLTIA